MADPGYAPVSPQALWIVTGALALIGLGVVVLTAPMAVLAGESAHALRSALHGLCAGLFMVTATIGLFQAYRLFAGHVWNVPELQIGSLINAGMAILTILSGNWIYIPYRAAEGPRTYFLQAIPEVHKIFFEFKEFAALFTVPLAVTAAYLLLRYGAELDHRKTLRHLIAILLVLVFFYFAVAFGLGAAVTKLQSV